MSIITLEGVVDKGEIRLTTNVRLPENTKVYVIVPDFEIEQVARIHTPRLAHSHQVSDFEMEIIQGDQELRLSQPTKRMPLRGLWKGIDISDEDITEARTEMWDDFPRKDI